MSTVKTIELVTNLDDKGLNEAEAGLKNLDKQQEKVASSSRKVEKQSKETSKGLKAVGENGGAIAVLDSLTGGLATRVRDAAEATRLFNFSLKGTRTALIATGIGAFVVALGAIVAYWDDIVDFISGSNEELEKQISLNNKIAQQANRELEVLDKKDNILKIQGKTEAQINKLKKDALNLVIQEQEESLRLANIRLKELEDLKKAGGGALEQFFRFGQSLAIGFGQTLDNLFSKIGLDTGFAKSAVGASGTIIEGIFGTQEDIAEQKNRIEELENTILDARNRLAGIQLSELENASETVDRPKNLEAIKSDGLSEVEITQEIQDKKLAVILEAKRKQDLADEYYADLERRRDQALASYKIDTALNVLGALQGIAEEGSAGAKAIGVAQAVLSTYQGINKALAETTDFTPSQSLRFLNAALVGVAGFANVAKILSTDSTGKTKPSLSGGTGGGVKAPSFNVVGTSGVNQLADSLNQDQQPIQAFVVGSEVTSQQELDNQTQAAATVG